MKYTILFLLLAGFLPISAVAAAKADQPSLQNLINAHVIVVSSTGDPLRPIVTQTGSKYHVKLTEWEGSGSEAEQTKMRERQYREYVANIISQIGDKEVLFFIHGGMNTADGAVERAAYLLDGPQRSQIPSKYYPIFICWDSPFAGTFWENVRWIRAGKTEEYSQAAHQMGRGYAFLTTPFRIVAEVGRAASRVPLQVAQFCYTGVYSVSPDGYTEHQVMEAELKELHEAKREKLKDNITVDHNPADTRQAAAMKTIFL